MGRFRIILLRPVVLSWQIRNIYAGSDFQTSQQTYLQFLNNFGNVSSRSNDVCTLCEEKYTTANFAVARYSYVEPFYDFKV
jgi:hypothetical protein